MDNSNFVNFLACQASAGSGKTFKLVTRYLILLFRERNPKKILAITFTTKATKEMYEKIVSVLKNPVKKDGSTELRDELQEVAESLNLSQKEVRKQVDEILDIFIKNSSEITIYTIDKFLNKILRGFSNHLDLTPNFSISYRLHEHIFFDNFSNEFSSSEYFLNFLELQRLESSYKFSDLLEDLENIYKKQNEFLDTVFEINQRVKFEDIVSIKQEIMQIFEDLQIEVTSKGLKRFAINKFEKLTSSTLLEKENLTEFKGYKKLDSKIAEKLFDLIKSKFADYFYLKESLFFKNLFAIYSFYKNFRLNFVKRENSLTFDDINILLGELLLQQNSHKIEPNFIYFRLDSTINHILIDEFQDTSVFQYRVLLPLIDEVLGGVGSNDDSKTFFYVGDEKQSIYRFRGGLSKIFSFLLEQKEHIEKENLEFNYRSYGKVLEFVNSKFESQSMFENFIPQKIPESNSKYIDKGYAEVIQTSKTELFSETIQQIRNLLSIGIKPHEITVLVYSNSEILNLTQLLENENIPATPFMSESLSKLDQIQALINYLYFVYFEKELYLKNFFALLGTQILEIDVVKHREQAFLIRDKTLIEIVNYAVQEFKIYDGESNIIKFIELVNQYDDLEKFIYNYEYEEPEITQDKSNGVSILTIHSSKGLEFDYVILMDKFKGDKNFKPRFYAEYSDIFISRLFLKQSKYELFSREYSETLRVEEKNKKLDQLNVLYVAFTRAKKGLIVVQKDEKSSFDLLNLTNEKVGQIEVLSSSSEKNRAFIFEANFEEKQYGTQEESLTDEEFENSDEVNKKNFQEREQEYLYSQFGTALHETIELMKNFDYKSLEMAMKSTQNRYPILDSQQREQIKHKIEHLINDQFFQSLTENKKIEKEVPFFYKNRKFILDLMMSSENEIIIIDYKSFKSPARFEKYQKQLKEYIKVVKNSDLNPNNKKISGYIAYLLDNKVEFVNI